MLVMQASANIRKGYQMTTSRQADELNSSQKVALARRNEAKQYADVAELRLVFGMTQYDITICYAGNTTALCYCNLVNEHRNSYMTNSAELYPHKVRAI